ncbi:MAG: hypothetical protein OSJ42_13400, partial [Bacteroidales bacterium]|nr:hypothetical protein [Bacteroidales bacterium]
NELHRRIAAAEQESRNTKYEAEKRMQRLENDARYKVQAAEASAAQKVADMEGELEEERRESAYQRDLNKNLLRIARERANADRKLKPKKEHTGYVVVASEEKEYRYRDGKKWKKVKLWETVLQSYYSVDFTEEEARTQIERDLLPQDGAWLIMEIGISARYRGRYEGMIEDVSVKEDFMKRNILLAGQQRLRANFRSGYWELVFMHTKALGIVPPDMRAR